MNKKDQLLLEQAYEEIYNEGIWDRLKGTGAGIKSALGAGIKNVGSKLSGEKPTGPTMGQAYAKSQQKSIFNSFLSKSQTEIKNFEADIQKLGGADLAALKKSHPEIEQKINAIKGLMKYLAGQKANINRMT